MTVLNLKLLFILLLLWAVAYFLHANQSTNFLTRIVCVVICEKSTVKTRIQIGDDNSVHTILCCCNFTLYYIILFLLLRWLARTKNKKSARRPGYIVCGA